jgi:lantibiotic modifying enzyme
MAWALSKLAAATGAERFQTAARAALAYERSLFSAEAGNWPDLRDRKTLGLDTHGATTFMVAWCQGAAGIGLSRLLMLPHFADDAMRAEIDVALATTLANGFTTTGAMNNHSLCHGDLGNLELLLQASETLGELQWRIHAEQIATQILAGVGTHGWLSGVPSQIETPGLMTGLAGIGYELLRLAEPARVPSVLALAPPR